MTRINKITIHGFKSFAHKTDIPFDSNFNVILGPNGSGKSNVGDALCFVLGRISAKSMRAEKAANLIFNGGKNKKPAASGTVEISFCNKNNIFPHDEKEMTISRTITKKGSSIYKINGKKHTRSQVVDTLASARINPSGYNIILQGDITRFVDMSPVERRKIIEEISDVSIYEEKKHKAMLELNKVDEKLNNAGIILKERKTYLRELKKDRDQALEFKEVKDKIDSHKATFLSMQINERRAVKEKYDAQIGEQHGKIGKAEEKIGDLKKKLHEKKDTVTSINQEIEKKGEKEQVRVHKEIEDVKVELAKDKTRISTLKDEIAKIQQRKDQFTIEIEELKKKTSEQNSSQKELAGEIKRRERELAGLEKSIADFKKKHKIETSAELEKELESKDDLIEKKQEEVQKVRAKQQELFREKDKIEFQLETIDQNISKVKEVASEHKEQLKVLQNYKKEFKGATLELNKCLDLDSSYASQIGNARNSLQDLREKHATLNAKAMSIAASLSSNRAVASITSNKKKFKGVHGTISELGKVDKKYGTALERAAGGKMFNIVVDDDKTASTCIKYLRDNKLGSASFIPLNKVRFKEISSSDKSLAKKAGAHDFALNLVSFKSQYKKAFANVFGNTLVVEDLSTARKIGIGSIKMATLDGDIAEGSGVMRGGFLKKKSVSGFAEKESAERLERVERQIGESESVIAAVHNKREANNEKITVLRTRRAELEAEIIKLEKLLHLETGDLDASSQKKKALKLQLKEVESELSTVQRSVSSLNKELAMTKMKKQQLRSQISELRNPRLLAQLRAFEESKQKCREDLLQWRNDLKNAQNNVNQLIAPELEKIQEILKQHEKEEKDFTVEIKTLSNKVKADEKELSLKEKASKEFYSKYKELFNRRDKLQKEINTLENDNEKARERIRNAEREVNLVSLKNAEVKAKLAGLEEEFKRYEDVELLKGKKLDELQKEITSFEIVLSKMSSVNMKALEVYEQVEKEYNSLVEKRDGLMGEKTDVLTLMNEIETKKKEHFMKTFNNANDHFQGIFTTLFKKGKAYLELENKDKPFDGGLNVKVKISGTRYMDIKSLSGGEKTLTALSFIFAIQEYQPASFYILDEIDAALDKHNAETLAKRIRDYSDRAQYIVISHNDSVIAEGDTLFGVSMKDGVSKVTSLKI